MKASDEISEALLNENPPPSENLEALPRIIHGPYDILYFLSLLQNSPRLMILSLKKGDFRGI